MKRTILATSLVAALCACGGGSSDPIPLASNYQPPDTAPIPAPTVQNAPQAVPAPAPLPPPSENPIAAPSPVSGGPDPIPNTTPAPDPCCAPAPVDPINHDPRSCPPENWYVAYQNAEGLPSDKDGQPVPKLACSAQGYIDRKLPMPDFCWCGGRDNV